MKKVITIILTVVLGLFVCACGEGGGKSGKQDGIYFEKESVSMIVNKTDYLVVKTEEKYSGDTDKMTFTSSDESVLTVKDATIANLLSCEVKTIKPGTATITATASNGKKASVEVTVFARLTATQNAVSVMKGETVSFPLSDLTGLTFASEDESIATVNDSGIITGVAVGETSVTASNGLSTTKVTVVVSKVTLPVTTFNMTIIKDEPTAFPLADTTGVTFTSANTAIVTVASDGKMTGVSEGVTTVTAVKGNMDATVTVSVVKSKDATVTLSDVADERFAFYGRTKFQGASVGQAFYYTASGFDVTFYGTQLKAELKPQTTANGAPKLSVYVDNESMTYASTTGNRVISVSTGKEYTLVSGLTEGWHTVKVRKRTPYQGGDKVFGYFALKSVSTDGFIGYAPRKSDFHIDFYGDSITSGFGNLTDGASETVDNTDGNMTYATVLANKLGASYNVVSVSGWGIAWRGNGDPNYSIPDQHKKLYITSSETYGSNNADLIVINLGTNDSNGLSKAGNTIDYFKQKYTTFLTDLREANPNAYIVCSYGMMGTNSTILTAINQVVTEKADSKISVLNFTKVGTAHPLVEDHKASATELENHLRSKNII